MTKKSAFEELKNGRTIRISGSVDDIKRARVAAHKFARTHGLKIVTMKDASGILRIVPAEKADRLPTRSEIRAKQNEKEIARRLRVEEHRREKLRRKYGHG